jgi:excisionase family DNA binding protein
MNRSDERIDQGLKVGIFSSGHQIFENRIAHEWLTTEKAAEYLGVSQNALRIMVHRGKIRTYRIGRRLRFRHEDCRVLFTLKGI